MGGVCRTGRWDGARTADRSTGLLPEPVGRHPSVAVAAGGCLRGEGLKLLLVPAGIPLCAALCKWASAPVSEQAPLWLLAPPLCLVGVYCGFHRRDPYGVQVALLFSAADDLARPATPVRFLPSSLGGDPWARLHGADSCVCLYRTIGLPHPHSASCVTPRNVCRPQHCTLLAGQPSSQQPRADLFYCYSILPPGPLQQDSKTTVATSSNIGWRRRLGAVGAPPLSNAPRALAGCVQQHASQPTHQPRTPPPGTHHWDNHTIDRIQYSTPCTTLCTALTASAAFGHRSTCPGSCSAGGMAAATFRAPVLDLARDRWARHL
jgi:hypothetical protein